MLLFCSREHPRRSFCMRHAISCNSAHSSPCPNFLIGNCRLCAGRSNQLYGIQDKGWHRVPLYTHTNTIVPPLRINCCLKVEYPQLCGSVVGVDCQASSRLVGHRWRRSQVCLNSPRRRWGGAKGSRALALQCLGTAEGRGWAEDDDRRRQWAHMQMEQNMHSKTQRSERSRDWASRSSHRALVDKDKGTAGSKAAAHSGYPPASCPTNALSNKHFCSDRTPPPPL